MFHKQLTKFVIFSSSATVCVQGEKSGYNFVSSVFIKCHSLCSSEVKQNYDFVMKMYPLFQHEYLVIFRLILTHFVGFVFHVFIYPCFHYFNVSLVLG